MSVFWLLPKQEIWSGVIARSARPTIEEVGSGLQSIRPECGRHGGMEEHRANAIIQCAQNTLGAAILWRHVRAGETENDAARGEEGSESGIVELLAVVRLERQDG